MKVSADKFGDWEAAGFAPEADILAALKAIDGVSTVFFVLESIMPVEVHVSSMKHILIHR